MPRLRFSIRDLLWLTVVVAILLAWRVDNRAIQRQCAIEFNALREELIDAANRLKPHPPDLTTDWPKTYKIFAREDAVLDFGFIQYRGVQSGVRRHDAGVLWIGRRCFARLLGYDGTMKARLQFSLRALF